MAKEGASLSRLRFGSVWASPITVLSFTASPDGRTVPVKREKICDNCAKTADKETEMTLEDFLDSLSAEQQRVALVHLSVKWAEQKAGGQNAEN